MPRVQTSKATKGKKNPTQIQEVLSPKSKKALEAMASFVDAINENEALQAFPSNSSVFSTKSQYQVWTPAEAHTAHLPRYVYHSDGENAHPVLCMPGQPLSVHIAQQPFPPSIAGANHGLVSHPSSTFTTYAATFNDENIDPALLNMAAYSGMMDRSYSQVPTPSLVPSPYFPSQPQVEQPLDFLMTYHSGSEDESHGYNMSSMPSQESFEGTVEETDDEFKGPPPRVYNDPIKHCMPLQLPNGDYEGMPTLEQFMIELEAYHQALNPRKRDKAIMEQAEKDSATELLVNPKTHPVRNAQWRWWVKKFFKIYTFPDGYTELVAAGTGATVAVKHQMYEILCGCHMQCAHGGRDKTAGRVSSQSYLHFVSNANGR
jgi:hypothetical protein